MTTHAVRRGRRTLPGAPGGSLALPTPWFWGLTSRLGDSCCQSPQRTAGSPGGRRGPVGAALRLQQSASAVSGSPTMSLCTSLKVSMNRSIHSCRSPPVANLARSAV